MRVIVEEYYPERSRRSSQIGRFLGIDPLADDGGQQTLSPYLAMGANLACNVDMLGLQFQGVANSGGAGDMYAQAAAMAQTLGLYMPGVAGGEVETCLNL